MGFLRTILILFIIFYVIRLFTRYILPSLFVNYMNDKVEEATKRQRHRQQKEREQARKREGEVSIDYSPENQAKNKPAKGDYIDYVEVKD